ncbi:MAG TPA: discoidin domain-containing protein [Rhodanobacter sp.]|jgi:hypothetical protein|nr:discoidin domain-containing protein [Rhodanobacter sp.]
MPAIPWFLGTLSSSYNQALSLDFEIIDASPQQKIVLETSDVAHEVGNTVSMVMLEIPLRGMVMFTPNGLNPGIDIQFGDLGWTYIAGPETKPGQKPPKIDVFVNEIGTPLFFTRAPSTITPDPGQGVTMWDIDASSSLTSWSQWNVADGDLTSNWSSIAYTNGQPAPNDMPWIEAKFPLTMPITTGRVVLYPRWGLNADGSKVWQPLCFPSQFTVSGHTSAGQSWDIYTSPSGFTAPPELQIGFCLRNTNSTPCHRVRATGKTLTDDGSSNYYFQLAEMEVYLNPIPVVSPPHATLTMTEEPGNWEASNLVDGTFQNAWSAPYWDNTFTSVAITLDLGQPTAFDRIVLYPRWWAPAGNPNGTPQVLGFPTAFALSASADGVNWNLLQNVPNLTIPTNQNTGIVIPVGNQFYQHIQLTITASETDGQGPVAQLLQIEVLQS